MNFADTRSLSAFYKSSVRGAWDYFSRLDDWPELDAFNGAWPRLQPQFREEFRLSFVEQPKSGQRRRRRERAMIRVGQMPGYEEKIVRERVIPTRLRNHHDLFNAMVWLTFPKSKWALHRASLAVRERGSAGPGKRLPAQDKLTLLDEGGVVLAVADEGKAVAALNGPSVEEKLTYLTSGECEVWVFGHGLFEAVGIGRDDVGAYAVMVEVPANYFSMNWDSRRGEVDFLLAGHLPNWCHGKNWIGPGFSVPLLKLGEALEHKSHH